MREHVILDPLAAQPATASTPTPPPAAPPTPTEPAPPLLPIEAPTGPLTARDVQRAALRDLVALSADCAAREARIEQRHTDDAQQSQAQHDRDKTQADARYSTQTQAARQEHEQYVLQSAAQHKAASETGAAAYRTQKDRLVREHDTAHRSTQKDLDHQVWLAESVFEGTEAKHEQETRKAKDQLDTDTEALQAIATKARELLSLYRFREPAPAEAQVATPEDPTADYTRRLEAGKKQLEQLEHIGVARLFTGLKPFIGLLLALTAAALVTQKYLGTWDPQWRQLGIVLGSTLGGILLVGIGLRLVAGSQVRRVYGPLRSELDAGTVAAKAKYDATIEELLQRALRDRRRRDEEVRIAKERYSPVLKRQVSAKEAAIKAADEAHRRQVAHRETARNQQEAASAARLAARLGSLEQEHVAAANAIAQLLIDATAANDQRHASERAELESHWNQRLALIQAPIDPRNDSQQLRDWSDPAWNTWRPPERFVSFARFGEFRVDLRQITDKLPKQLKLPDTFTVPAQLVFPQHASLVIHTDHDGRQKAIDTLQMIMARLLTSLPPGRVRFTIVDPVGLGENFAGFMHLTDHDENLVGARIWTESAQIEQRLANLTDHMETVIQKYLRNEFETIDDYNAQAGELAEPYRFLVVADFPTGWQGDSFRRLNSIATSGARCGIYMLVVRDTRVPLPAGVHLDELEAHSANLVRKGGSFTWRDDVFGRFPLKLDEPPGEQFLTGILDRVGQGARDARRVEVPFEAVVPAADQLWSGDCTDELTVPIGRLGATRLQTLRLGRGVAQHALIAGKTGSGKSTLLHVLVTNLALWYHPDQVEFYLVDFKKGVEFKTYAAHGLPHARAIAVESDREFGLSVLQRIDAELTRRGELFRKLGVQELSAYRQASKQKLPRTLLIIDEFQEFFSEDDRLAQESSLLLDRLVRQGRAFGIHVLLGSQTIGGTSGLPRSTLGQIAIRIALQMGEADSQLILGDNNSAARLLSRPGEAIYNDAGGLVEGNSPFQVAWLPDDVRDRYLEQVGTRTRQELTRREATVVFEGNAPADVAANPPMARLLETTTWPTPTPVRQMWVGEPVAIKSPTSIALRRQSGSNVLLIGQQDESALALMACGLVALGLQHKPGSAQFVIMDGTPADSAMAGVLARTAAALPHDVRLVEYRGVPEAMGALGEELDRRRTAEQVDAPTVYAFIYGLQRYRALRRQEENFDFAAAADAKAPQPDKVLAELLRDGPGLGIHVIAWADTVASVERSIDRASMREFDHRVLFQMSAADSSGLIDSPIANRLGFYRALAYSEEQGVMEKFRPFALPTPDWLGTVAARLRARTV